MGRTTRHGRYFHRALTLVDFLILNGVFFVVSMLNPDIPELHGKLVWVLLNIAYIPAARSIGKIHKVRAMQMDRLSLSTLHAVGYHALCFIFLLYFLDLDAIPWYVFGEFYGVATVLLMLWWLGSHYLLKAYRRRGRSYTRIVIVGCSATAERLLSEMESDSGFGYRCQGFFDIYCPPSFKHKSLYAGNLSDLEDFVVANHTDEIFYTISGENREAVQLILGLCEKHMIKFHFVPQISPYLTRKFRLDSIGEMPVLEVRTNPLEGNANRLLKRTFDVAFSGTFLLFSPIIFIPVAIAIKLSSPGPVFFKQMRTGYMGRDFLCWKFRTMKVNAEADTLQATKDDPRKTRVGDFLRRTSLDELPQFINVFKGDMSVVGPRPHMLKHTEDYRRLIGQYMVRHLIKPGITGWAQVRGYRGQTEELWQMERRVEHDIWYIEHWTFLLDLKIIFRTVMNAFSNEEQAY
ncbi:MAG: undecaprenyl-phosphate glucose phosphotransferase [Staphylococcus sp.]|nr:undecaprenyl-phosphate glucose phosphotransferase [Staphylococcus sp.]